MPSVASEASKVLSSRQSLPSPRNQQEPGHSAFADMLDDTSAANQQPAPQARADRARASDDTDRSNPSGNDSASATDTDNSPATAGQSASTDSASKNTNNGKSADTNKDAARKAKDGDASSSAGVDRKVKTDADQSDALAGMLANANSPGGPAPTLVAAVQSLTLIANGDAKGDADADALAALQAAGGEPHSPNGPAKPGQPQADKAGDATAKNAAESPAAVPQIEAGKDNQGKGEGKSSGEHNAGDLLAKLDLAAAAQGSTDTSGAAKASADAAQNAVATSNVQNGAAVAPGAVPSPAQVQAGTIPLSNLAVEIASQAHAGKNHFEIRLDPPELGRIDVKLHVDGDGNVSTRLMVDRADTLDLLKRDASSLERALQQSGLKTSDNGMQFELRQHAFSAGQTVARITVSDDDPAPLEALRQGYGRLLGLGGGLDIRV